MTDLTFEPLIPGALWLVIAAGGAGLLAWYVTRRPAAVSRRRWGTVATLMAGAFAAVMGLLLNPTWSRELPPPAGKPVLTVLLDASGSMATPDAAGGQTRYAAAAHVAADLAAGLSDTFDVRVRAFDQTVRAVDAASLAQTADQATGPGTDLSAAVNSGLAEEHAQGQAVVLLSDGIDNAGGGTGPVLAAVRTAKAMAAPVYAKSFGGQVKSLDLAVDIRSPQDMAVVGQKVPISARVTHVGITQATATVTLWQAGKQVARREAILGPGDATDVNFQVTADQVGVHPYEVRVDPVPGETSQANNSASYVLRVVDEPMRVLVLEGKPYWDGKFLTRTLMADPAVALDIVVRLSDSRLLHRTLTHKHAATTGPSNAPPNPDADRDETWQVDTDPTAVLASADKLRGYQVIVVGRDAEPFLTPAAIANLQQWVSQQGGSLLCYRGSPTSDADQRLSKLLPVRWTTGNPSRFRVALTAPGKDLNWFGQSDSVDAPAGSAGAALPRLPSLSADDAVASAKPLAVVLATAVGDAAGASQPAVVYQQYGTGRVVVVEGSGMWRWAFLAPQYQDQEQVYATLWHSMLRWLTSAPGLTPGQSVSLRAEKVRFGTDEPATATLFARDDVPRDKLPSVVLHADPASAAESPDAKAVDGKTFAPAPLGSEAGTYRINFGLLPPGRYSAQIAGAKPDDATATVVFDVRKYDQEMLDLEARPDLMARVAADSGGQTLGDDPVAQVRQAFKEHMAAVQPPRVERTSAWDRWWLLIAVLGLWSASWVVRRSGGLV